MSPLNASAHRPTGTLTLMFTDIEGSTLLWEKHDTAIMAAVMEAHNTILRTANAAWGGTEIRSEGDAFFFIFPTASDAVTCALEIQVALNVHPWHKDVGQLRVRIGVHTGDMLLLDDEYHGMPANLAKRITDAAHGGQVLLSAATYELVKTQFPSGSFTNLGEHRLKNIQHPEAIFQFRAPQAAIPKIIGEKRWCEVLGKDAATDPTCIPELQTEFPPLKTLNNLPNNLPAPMNSFIGRETEIRSIVEYLIHGQTRLVTLTGPGGIGKTRLALEAATELLDTYPDGVWFIPLADLIQPEHVITEIATALSLPLEPTQDTIKQVVSYLSGKALLLVLDNFEHLMDAGTDVKTLLLQCPQLRCLVTSREFLRIVGEQRFVVPPLSIPSEDAAYEGFQYSESVQLFLDRAAAIVPNFQLTQANAEAIGAICRIVDGISLAIELAAARVRGMTPQHILERLEMALNTTSKDKYASLLSAQNQDIPARHQTLDAIIDWSYRLLAPDEQRLLCELSLFSGGFFLEAAETICIATSFQTDTEILNLIFNLYDKSLLISDEHLGRTRYRLSVPLQLYLQGKSQQTGFRKAHARYYLTFAQQQNEKLQGAEQTTALSEMAIELDNFRAAFGFAQGNADWLAFGQLAAALSQFFYVRGLWSEGLAWLKQTESALQKQLVHCQASAAVSVTETNRFHLTLAEIRVDLAQFYNARQECQRARQLCEDALQTFRTLKYSLGIVKALNRLGIIARYQDQLEESDTHFTEALQTAKLLDDTWQIAFALNNLGLTAYRYGHFEAAKERYAAGLSLARELGDKRGIAYALNNLGTTASRQGLREEAKRYHTESLEIRQELADKRGIATSLNHLGLIAYHQTAYEEAHHSHTKSLHIQRELGDKRGSSYSLSHLGLIAYQQNNDTDARRYYTESLQLARELPAPGTNLPYLLDSLGKIALRQGEHEEAKQYYLESLQHRRKSGKPHEIADSLYQFGRLARAEGQLERSLYLFLQTVRIYTETGTMTRIYAEAVKAAITAVEAGIGNPEKVEKLKSEIETQTLQELINTRLIV